VVNIKISFILMFMLIGQGTYVIKYLKINGANIGNVVVTLTEKELVLPVHTKENPLKRSHCARRRTSLCLV
jgi:hypothetical protein